MQIIRGLHNLKTQFASGCVATIGNYDGVHLGHQKIIEIVKEKSAELKLPAVVVIFEPQPEEFFTGDRSMRLTSLHEKKFLLEKHGINRILVLPFNLRFADITASRFITEILLDSLHVSHLVVGDDFVFGYKREGNFSLLKQASITGNFQVTEVAAFKIDGVRVSSSLIRSALWQGNLDSAAKFLGRPYSICGRVVPGDHIGHKIGFPTANIHLKRRELPLMGIYAVKVYNLAQTPLFGLANIGFRPTILSKKKLLEVYILDFDANIYGKRIMLEFCKKIRDEKKFNSLAELKAQIEDDVTLARKNRLEIYETKQNGR